MDNSLEMDMNNTNVTEAENSTTLATPISLSVNFKRRKWECRQNCDRIDQTNYFVCQRCKRIRNRDDNLKGFMPNLKLSFPKLSNFVDLVRKINPLRSKRSVSPDTILQHTEIIDSLIDLLNSFDTGELNSKSKRSKRSIKTEDLLNQSELLDSLTSLLSDFGLMEE